MESMFYVVLILFFLFAISGVYIASSPVYSIISLVWCFILSSLLLFFLGEEFIGCMLLVVYVGAVAVLFLFVVMLLGTRLSEITWAVLPVWFNICIIILSGIVLVVFFYNITDVFLNFAKLAFNGVNDFIFMDDSFFFNDVNNLIILAYEVVSSPLLIVGALILLVAMLAAISLTTWR